VSYAINFGEGMEPEDKDKAWKAEEPIEETNQEELTEEE
jgi:hypothetical protein